MTVRQLVSTTESVRRFAVQFQRELDPVLLRRLRTIEDSLLRRMHRRFGQTMRKTLIKTKPDEEVNDPVLVDLTQQYISWKHEAVQQMDGIH